MHTGLARQRLVAVFLLGMVLLNDPLLALVARLAAARGSALLYVYTFTVWAALIAATAWIIERNSR